MKAKDFALRPVGALVIALGLCVMSSEAQEVIVPVGFAGPGMNDDPESDATQDEDPLNGIDDDFDGLVDEDPVGRLVFSEEIRNRNGEVVGHMRTAARQVQGSPGHGEQLLDFFIQVRGPNVTFSKRHVYQTIFPGNPAGRYRLEAWLRGEVTVSAQHPDLVAVGHWKPWIPEFQWSSAGTKDFGIVPDFWGIYQLSDFRTGSATLETPGLVTVQQKWNVVIVTPPDYHPLGAVTYNFTRTLKGGFSTYCAADANNDCSVDVGDLSTVILEWDTPGPEGDVNEDGTVNVTDLIDVITGWGDCPEPCAANCPGEGVCCQPNDSPGCEDPMCCERVCADDSFCCNIAWDDTCASAARDACACPAVGACCFADHSCMTLGSEDCVNGGGSYMGDDVACVMDLCAQVELGACCLGTQCVGMNQMQCAMQGGVYHGDGVPCLAGVCTSCPGEGGSCCTANGTPGCDDPVCCDLVCAVDPMCCDATWDEICADYAADSCGVCGPGNDDCADAVEIFEGDTLFSNLGATDDGPPLPPECNQGTGLSFGSDIWYAFTPTCDGMLTVSTCNQADYDTRLVAYTGDCGNLSVIACNDDVEGCGGFTSMMQFPVTCGTEILLRVGGYGGDQGSGTLTVACAGESCFEVCGPGHGDCCSDNGTPGCDAPGCCEMVCTVDTYCCDVLWDAICVGDAQLFCSCP